MSAFRESTEQPRDVHRGTAAHIDAARAFRQCEERRLVGNADVAGSGQL
jgi:hypothetical protein